MGEGFGLLRRFPKVRAACLKVKQTIQILICYVTAGAGHRRAGEAIAKALGHRYPTASVECVDVLSFTPNWFRGLYPWLYLFLVQRLPRVWRVIYGTLDHSLFFRLIQPLRRSWNILIGRRFLSWLKASRPNIVVATHFFPADLCRAGRRGGWLRAPVVVVVTDLHPHRFWMAPEVEAMVVATTEAKSVCEECGVMSECLHVIGIPIELPEAGGESRIALRTRLGFASGRLTVMLTSGGTTVGPFDEVAWALMELENRLPGKIQLLVVCGDDEKAAQRIRVRAQKTPMPVHVFGFVENMLELMGVADLVVAKAGGVTSAEALAQGLPLIFYHAIPGQESKNAEYIYQRGAGVIARKPSVVADAVSQFLKDSQFASDMKKAARSLSRPNATEAIVSEIIEPLLSNAPAKGM